LILWLNYPKTELEMLSSKGQQVHQVIMSTPARIVVAASGSRGDVQPYCAIALALRARGHHVVVATEQRMKGLVEEFGLEFRVIEGDPTGLLWEPKAQEALKTN
jgi:UDP:flavonoid glycosyltransferase YjiC (YdhE family)